MLFTGLREEPRMAVSDAATGKVVASFLIGPGVDRAECAIKTQSGAKTTAFDAGRRSLQAANRRGEAGAGQRDESLFHPP